jgi:hypothetical protein
MIQVLEVHFVGGSSHEHIQEVRWRNPEDGKTGHSSRSVMVEWVRRGGTARVENGGRRAYIGVVEATPPYIRTYADGVWSDNLLALPRY